MRKSQFVVCFVFLISVGSPVYRAAIGVGVAVLVVVVIIVLVVYLNMSNSKYCNLQIIYNNTSILFFTIECHRAAHFFSDIGFGQFWMNFSHPIKKKKC